LLGHPWLRGRLRKQSGGNSSEHWYGNIFSHRSGSFSHTTGGHNQRFARRNTYEQWQNPHEQFGMSSTCGSGLAPGTSCVISATFAPKDQGAISGTITIHDSASSKPRVIELTGSGTVVKLAPASLNLGTVKVGNKSAPEKIQLTNPAARC
jgi:hypothetical protein